MAYNVDTPRGYNLAECVSALQKCIRLGEARDALYWAIEIEGCGKGSRTRLWNRLKIICSEDIGPTADGNLVTVLVGQLAENYFSAWERSQDSYRLFLSHAIIAMCRAQKSRIACDLVGAVYMQEEHLEIPDRALDMHTPRGRQMGRGQDHWYEYAGSVQPESDEFGEWGRDIAAEAKANSYANIPYRNTSGAVVEDDDIAGKGPVRML